MSDAAWKRMERDVAKALGGTRTGPTGRNTTDISGVALGVECKYMGKLSLRSKHVEQAKKNAGKLPWVLVIMEKGSHSKLAVVDFDYFVQLWKDKNG